MLKEIISKRKCVENFLCIYNMDDTIQNGRKWVLVDILASIVQVNLAYIEKRHLKS